MQRSRRPRTWCRCFSAKAHRLPCTACTAASRRRRRAICRRKRRHADSLRNRGAAERWQVDAVQRADARPDCGRELPLLHHRPERGRGRGSRPAAATARGHRAPGEDRADHRRVRRHRRTGRRSLQGEGLGNQFLSHIREVDAIAHVVRCFEDDDVVHVAGRIDPLSDVEIIDTELALADLSTLEKGLERAAKAAKSGDKDAIRRRSLFERVKQQLDTGRAVRAMSVSEEERRDLRELQLLTAKPVMYVANVAEHGFTNNPMLSALETRAAGEGAVVVAVCASIEAEIAQLEVAERAEFLAELGLAEPGLNRVIRAGYRLLGLLTFFTAGPKEVRAWTVRRGATAPQAAGVIHTDFERGFIRAEVIAFEDYIAGGGEAGAKEAGKLRLEGKEYLVQEGDVVHFRFNV